MATQDELIQAIQASVGMMTATMPPIIRTVTDDTEIVYVIFHGKAYHPELIEDMPATFAVALRTDWLLELAEHVMAAKEQSGGRAHAEDRR